jgi:ABC-type molybdate transport system substrate-binding protein
MSRLSLLVILAAASAAAPLPLRVKASPAVAPCVAAAGLEYERTAGRKVIVETAGIGSPSSADGADVVVAADQELNRVIESGATHPDLDVDVARIPWVLTTPPGTPSPEIGALARSATHVRVLGGTVAREALRNLSLQGLTPAHSERLDGTRGPVRLAAGEAAIVPLSLAGPGPVSPLSVPPIVARALGVRASAQTAAARAFLDFLKGPGNEAFSTCGRPPEGR